MAVLSRRQSFLFLGILVAAYVLLGIFTLNNCYFWDVIQQVSKEGYWFYKTDFSSLLIPADNEYGIWATGYHPPLMGLMTAALWKIFGYELWVSHVFSMLWAALLIYNTWKLVLHVFPQKHVGWVTFVLLLEPPILTQYVIASPDFILFTSFVMAMRGMVERKPWLLMLGVFFTCGVNMRGVFVVAALFIVHLLYVRWEYGQTWLCVLKQVVIPYLPSVFMLSAYFIYFFLQKGWFFSDSPYSSHYALPHSLRDVLIHLCSFGMRSIENGRVVIWLLAFYLVCKLGGIRLIESMTNIQKVFLCFFLLLHGLYFLFVFITQMPFTPRYFMPQFFVFTMLVASLFVRYFSSRCIKIVCFVVVLSFVTGHFWIYPERIAKLWDATLAHLPFYELREKVFDYIDNNSQIDYDKVDGAWVYADRGFMEMREEHMRFAGQEYEEKEYFIYSNILNVPDGFFDELHDPALWTPMQTFKKWPVIFTIYQKRQQQSL